MWQVICSLYSLVVHGEHCMSEYFPIPKRVLNGLSTAYTSWEDAYGEITSLCLWGDVYSMRCWKLSKIILSFSYDIRTTSDSLKDHRGSSGVNYTDLDGSMACSLANSLLFWGHHYLYQQFIQQIVCLTDTYLPALTEVLWPVTADEYTSLQFLP